MNMKRSAVLNVISVMLCLILCVVSIMSLLTMKQLKTELTSIESALEKNNALMEEILNGANITSAPANSQPGQQVEEHRVLVDPTSGIDTSNEKMMDTVKLLPTNGTDWHFEFPLKNDTDVSITLELIVVYDYIGGVGGEVFGEAYIERHRFADIALATDGDTMVLEPGEEAFWEDWHPVVDFFDARKISFVFGSEKGNVIYSYPFELVMEGSAPTPEQAAQRDWANDEGQDLITLIHDAEFEVEVYEDVFWVPANDLGMSAYKNCDVMGMLSASPKEKADMVHTFYEAVQFYQIGGFYASDDNIRAQSSGYMWEHHKPGFDAVRTNTGCCATSANWLNYVLREDYEDVGFISTSQRDGSGHIFNYLKHDDWYYIIDMTHYRTDWIATAMESGDMDDYRSTDFIAGNIHKTRDIKNYVEYVQNTYNDPPGLMFMYAAGDCLAIDSPWINGKCTIVYEQKDDVNVNVIFDDPMDELEFLTVDPPASYPNWDHEQDYRFE